MKSLLSLALLAFLITSCVTQKVKISKIEHWIDSTQIDDHSFVGIKIYDPKTQEVIFAKNEKRYFVPASNTKILSLYASLKNLGDSIPALKYLQKGDSLFISGTADPTFLHPDLPKTSGRAFDGLMYRHWKSWHDYAYSNVFLAPYKDGQFTGKPVNIQQEERSTPSNRRSTCRRRSACRHGYRSLGGLSHRQNTVSHHTRIQTRSSRRWHTWCGTTPVGRWQAH
ncbi:MAG: hypothetical protein EAZ54_10130 [Curvibacter sp.]|nr:MAG: hypothetical protein EAZ54_10130 [Curvibacter sp.]